MKYLILVLALSLVACTNTHRLAVVYESADAVKGTLQIIESGGSDFEVKSKASPRQPTKPSEAKQDEEEKSNSLLDSIALP